MTSLRSTNVFAISCLSVEPSPPPPPRSAPVNLVLQHWCKALQSLCCTIRRLFVLFVAYSRTIRTIRRLYTDYSYYSSTIRGLFVDYSRYSHYSLHYSSFINYRMQTHVCDEMHISCVQTHEMHCVHAPYHVQNDRYYDFCMPIFGC